MCQKSLSEHDNTVLRRIFNPELPYSDTVNYEEESEAENTENLPEAENEARQLEIEGVKAAESGDVGASLERFNSAINRCPSRASCYNNRAQALRLKGDTACAMLDVNKALELSGGKGKAATQAFVQRGLLNKKEGQDEKALDDFKHAAKLGSAFAKHVVVQMNPYAAMCNAMLAEVMQKVKCGEDTA
ncbi:unnamed protein product [Owenia fusiformis]|uniref:Uncharacterized protein n=1 Tax=Owenia fusiformis TaxID=6347 RepID=A0A8J1XYW0_OWEFU|nr:unnamed protein product [Owenia fusiformis]